MILTVPLCFIPDFHPFKVSPSIMVINWFWWKEIYFHVKSPRHPLSLPLFPWSRLSQWIVFSNIKQESSMNSLILYMTMKIYFCFILFILVSVLLINTLWLPVGEKAVFSTKSNTNHSLFLPATYVEIGNCFSFDKVQWTFDFPHPPPTSNFSDAKKCKNTHYRTYRHR